MIPASEERRLMGSILIHAGRWSKTESRQAQEKELKAMKRNLDALIDTHNSKKIRSRQGRSNDSKR